MGDVGVDRADPAAQDRLMVLALVAFVGISIVHLAAQLAAPDGPVAPATQVVLMPLLAWVLLAGTRAPRGRLVRLALVALGFSWLGDTLPKLASGDAGFLLMVGGFLLAQVAYGAAFLPSWRASLVARAPLLLIPYAAVLVTLVALCWRGAGGLLLPVVVYGLALTTMAVLATGLGWQAGVGGAVFLVSDSLIALHAFASLDLPAQGFWVMLTYIVGQALLVLGVAGSTAPSRRAPTSTGDRRART